MDILPEIFQPFAIQKFAQFGVISGKEDRRATSYRVGLQKKLNVSGGDTSAGRRQVYFFCALGICGGEKLICA